MTEPSSEPWSRLWNTGVLHSCATSISGNYDGPTLAFWRRQFDSIEEGARVVDLGTGNGALLLLARTSAQERGIRLRLHGIDIADIDPPRRVPGDPDRFAGIAFHPLTSASVLPFADGEVDFVCSQFGFEYAARDATLHEIMRVARHRSRIGLVLHSDDSIIAEVAVSQREGFRFLREASPIIGQARTLLPVLFHASRNASSIERLPGAEAARLAFNASARHLMDQIERLPHALVLKNVARTIGGALDMAARSPADAERVLGTLERNLRDEEARIEQQQQAQLCERDLHVLCGQLRDHGYHVEHSVLEQRTGVKVGWTLEAARG